MDRMHHKQNTILCKHHKKLNGRLFFLCNFFANQILQPNNSLHLPSDNNPPRGAIGHFLMCRRQQKSDMSSTKGLQIVLQTCPQRKINLLSKDQRARLHSLIWSGPGHGPGSHYPVPPPHIHPPKPRGPKPPDHLHMQSRGAPMGVRGRRGWRAMTG